MLDDPTFLDHVVAIADNRSAAGTLLYEEERDGFLSLYFSVHTPPKFGLRFSLKAEMPSL